MRNPTRWSLGSVALSGLILLSGCGSNNDDAPVPPPLLTGYLVGNLIEGVPYECGAEKGRSGRLGQFSYKAGDTCAFRVGAMAFPVTPAKLQKGYVTAYDLTATETEAWTLMAILESIAYWRPGGNNLMVVDNNLEPRIPLVNLKQGDLAVAAAVATFKGTVKPVPVSNARILLARTVNLDNSLVIPLESLVAQGKANLNALRIATKSGEPYVSIRSPAARGEVDHSERVNLRFYDYEGNPLAYAPATTFTPSYLPIKDDVVVQPPLDTSGLPYRWTYWPTTPLNQNPTGNVPQFGSGADQGTLSGSNIVAFNWDVGQKASTAAGTAFQNALFWANNNSSPSPLTVFGSGADPSSKTNTSYPQDLNFFFSVNLSGVFGTASNPKGFSCQNMMFGQSQTKASLSAIFDFLYQLGDTALDGVELAGTDGTDIQADWDFMGNVKSLAKAAKALGTEHWWVFGVNAQTQSYRVTIKGNPAIIMPCTDVNAQKVMPVVINSTHDDHTYNVFVAFNGQTLQGIGAAGCSGSSCPAPQ